MATNPPDQAPGSAPPGNIPEYTVGELSVALKRTVEDRFGRVRVRGEISGFKRHTSGHLYFTLKDTEGTAVLDAACFRNVAQTLRIKPEDGLEVVATGRVTTYPDRSKYQIIVERMEAAGLGAWLALLEERRKKLTAEGLFDATRKRRLPFLPATIGVVTSPTGAVIRDILHRLADRFPRRVLVWPVLVQGEGAAAQVAAAIAGFNALPAGGPVPRPDVLIVARGGGSIEDLWAFNEEIVVRAAAASAIPLVSAVGHETDTTLIDFAADVRAPTPTAAAEMVVPVRAELLRDLAALDARLAGAAQRGFETRRSHLAGLARGLPDPQRLLETKAQRFDHAVESLRRSAQMGLAARAHRVTGLAGRLRHPREIVAAKRAVLAHAAGALRPQDFVRGLVRQQAELDRLAQRLRVCVDRRVAERAAALESCRRLLDGLGYQQVLKRGFVLVKDATGHPVTAAATVEPGMALTLTFHDAERHATADGGSASADGGPASRPSASRPATRKPGPQGDLF